MPAYVVEIRRESLGSGEASLETVCALADDEHSVLTLVKTALRLEDEAVRVVRSLAEEDAHKLGLKPFQVKRMA